MKRALAGDKAAANEVTKVLAEEGSQRTGIEFSRQQDIGIDSGYTSNPSTDTSGQQMSIKQQDRHLNGQTYLVQQQQQQHENLDRQKMTLRMRSSSLTRLQHVSAGVEEHPAASSDTTSPGAGSRVSSASMKSAGRPPRRPLTRRLSAENNLPWQQCSDDATSSGLDVQCRRYDDAMRYAQFGLFDTDFTGGSASNDALQRPPHNSLVKPRSAGPTRGVRPLKYEVFRPVTQPAGNNSRHVRRTVSAKTTTMQPIGRSFLEENAIELSQNDSDKKCDNKVTVSPEESADEDVMENSSTAEIPPGSHGMPPLEYAKTYDADQRRLKAMENSFRQRALRLQQQLGIAPEGMIFIS
jgi:hypothetical protein